ncbi:MAG: hypothetical protein KGJ86_16090, partial [Chloroflexota bacterium]|nr:hypothetical protein [Chloroflexota bacterium]
MAPDPGHSGWGAFRGRVASTAAWWPGAGEVDSEGADGSCGPPRGTSVLVQLAITAANAKAAAKPAAARLRPRRRFAITGLSRCRRPASSSGCSRS